MGALGGWIDGLTDEERDRIVRAQSWRPCALVWRDGARCLVGHVSDAQPAPDPMWEQWPGGEAMADVRVPFPFGDYPAWPAGKFDALCKRFGTERVVRAIKKRAGADLPEPDTALVGGVER